MDQPNMQNVDPRNTTSGLDEGNTSIIYLLLFDIFVQDIVLFFLSFFFKIDITFLFLYIT